MICCAAHCSSAAPPERRAGAWIVKNPKQPPVSRYPGQAAGWNQRLPAAIRQRQNRAHRFKRSACTADLWYGQSEHEWVLLVKGEATLRFEQGNETIHLTPGSYVNIAAHERHRVEWTAVDEETVWLAVFYCGGGLLVSTRCGCLTVAAIKWIRKLVRFRCCLSIYGLN